MRALDLAGRRFGRLTVEELAAARRLPSGRAYRMWSARCDCGTRTIVRGTALTSGNTTSCGCLHQERLLASVTKDTVDYKGAHDRVRAAKGGAASHACTDCAGPARDWSYDGLDPNELADPRGLRYSLDIGHYVPRCRSCHKRHDLKVAG